MALPNDSILVTPGSGATVPTHLVSAKEYEVVMVADIAGHIMGGNVEVGVSISESVATQVAATYSLKKQWLVPSGFVFRPKRVMSTVTTAGSRTLFASGQKLGSFNVSTNVFTDGASVASPRHYDRMIAIVTTDMSAVVNTVTVTYTNELGVAGKTTAALSIPASSPVGTMFEFMLAVTTGVMKDGGVRDVTAVADTAAPTGVLEIWGLNTIQENIGLANTLDRTALEGCAIPDTESVFIMFNQVVVTAQLRTASIMGIIG